jgi:hypothetical protein
MIFNVVCQAVGTEDPQSQQCEGKMLTRSRSSRLELLESPSNASRSYPDLPHRSQRLQSLAELLRFERPRSHPRSTLGHVEIDSRCRGEQRDTAKRETTRVCLSICLVCLSSAFVIPSRSPSNPLLNLTLRIPIQSTKQIVSHTLGKPRPGDHAQNKAICRQDSTDWLKGWWVRTEK